MNISRLSAALVTTIGMLFAISAASQDCWAVIVYFNGSTSTDFLNGTNWTPAGVPGNNLVDLACSHRPTVRPGQETSKHFT